MSVTGAQFRGLEQFTRSRRVWRLRCCGEPVSVQLVQLPASAIT
jgi:hypothetical protein